MEDKTIIQSYVYNDNQGWFVSTIERDSSAAAYPCRFLETLVWRLDAEQKRTDLIHQGEGYGAHFEICKNLIASGEKGLEPDDE